MTGAELKQMILKSGIEQAEIARRLGMSLQALQKRYKPDEVKESFVKKVQGAINQKVDSYKPPSKPVKTDKLDVLVETVQILASSVMQDRDTLKKRLTKVESNLSTHGTAIESLLDWKEVVDDTLEVIAAQLKPLMLSEQNSGAAVRGKKRGN
jgi:transcriptional regulator with XRE-family HTH domain